MADSQKTGAILTPSQREFLRGNIDEEASDAKLRMKRQRIVDRIQASLIDDIPLITEALATDNKPNSLSGEKIADIKYKTEFQKNLPLLVAFAGYLSRELGIDPDEVISEGKDTEFKSRSQKLSEKIKNNPDSVTLGELMDMQDDLAQELIHEKDEVSSEGEIEISSADYLQDDESDGK